MGLRGRGHGPVMFYGEYEHTVDEKNRLTLPARFRHALAGGVVLAKGIERNIDVFPSESWSSSVARVAELDPFEREAREMKRHVFAGAAMSELDGQGRVLIPPRLAEHAGIGKEVVVAGVHDHLEIWDRSEWAARQTAMEGSAGDVAERLATKRG